MSAQTSRVKRAARNMLTVLGFLLMIASFVWMQRTPRSERAARSGTAQPPAKRKPFAVVVLDPGHGGQDSGAMCGGVLEKDLTLDVARRIDRLLEADRVAFANRVSNCIFLSIHFNEDNQPVSSGVETYYAPHQITAGSSLASWLPFLWRALSESPNPESENLAGSIQEALVTRTRAADRGTKPGQFFVITNVTSPAALVEGGFLTNTEDISKLASEDYREQIAAAVADGILRYRDGVSQRQSALAVTNSGALNKQKVRASK
jgi:N-acetylmuramoyl-L-alanine amidase